MQVDIRLTLGFKALGFNQLKVRPLSKSWFSDVNLHPYIAGIALFDITPQINDAIAKAVGLRAPGSV